MSRAERGPGSGCSPAQTTSRSGLWHFGGRQDAEGTSISLLRFTRGRWNLRR